MNKTRWVLASAELPLRHESDDLSIYTKSNVKIEVAVDAYPQGARRTEMIELAEYLTRAGNNYETLSRALGEIATSVAYVLVCRQCPAKMKPGLQAIVDAATNALNETTKEE